jgi:hypothetical protein
MTIYSYTLNGETFYVKGPDMSEQDYINKHQYPQTTEESEARAAAAATTQTNLTPEQERVGELQSVKNDLTQVNGELRRLAERREGLLERQEKLSAEVREDTARALAELEAEAGGPRKAEDFVKELEAGDGKKGKGK